MATTLSLGDEFETFSDLELRVREYEKVTYTKFRGRDSRTVAALQRRRARNINIKEELVYGEATYCCKQGGREFKSQTTGERPNTSSSRQKCPARFRVKASQDGQRPIIVDINLEHDHKILRSLYDHLPSERKLTDKEKEKVSEMLHMNANKKRIQQHISQNTGKVSCIVERHPQHQDRKESQKNYPR